jgi:hypothetical protein
MSPLVPPPPSPLPLPPVPVPRSSVGTTALGESTHSPLTQ